MLMSQSDEPNKPADQLFDSAAELAALLPKLEALTWSPYEIHQAMRARGFDLLPLKADGRLVEIIEAEFVQRYASALTAQLAQGTEAEALRSALPMLLPILQQLSLARPETRRLLQEQGVDVLPVNFYSNTPSLAEIESSFEYQGETGPPPYLFASLFDAVFMQQWLDELSRFAHEFNPPHEGDAENATRYFWNNGQFMHSDPLAYYCLLRKLQPRTVVEIGAGFSTLVAHEALTVNGHGRIVCVEPYPRPFLSKLPLVTLHQASAQSLTCEWLHEQLQDGDVLFIDSTHTVKTGSDCLHLYLRLIPHLQRQLYLHVHDVFLPHGLPQRWLRHRQIYWTEQYLLLALLLDNPKVRVLYGSAYHGSQNLAALKGFMQGRASAEGGSFWFTYDGRLA